MSEHQTISEQLEREQVLQLWEAGLDTYIIAGMLLRSEAKVYSIVASRGRRTVTHRNKTYYPNRFAAQAVRK